jgi:ferritin-like metal-binding protein YciE
VVEWLRDAHAAEEQAHTMLGRTAQQIEGHAEFRQGLQRHAEASQGQAQRLKDCLEQLGEGPSAFKTLTGQVSAFAQSLSGYVVSDEPVKAVLATSTFAQMEVSSYRILATAAATARLEQVEALCRALLEEETAFADWLERQSGTVTREFLLDEKAEA